MICYILLEMMDQGSLFDFMEKHQKSRFSEKKILSIFGQICQGVKIMHSMNPPRAHRDLKIENVLFNGKQFKLCDFGSVSTEIVDFKNIPRSEHEEKMGVFEKKTTITYRAPEMCDPFLRYKVDQKVDIWMLGCILFALAFFKHPFQECTTLSIANASYYLPEKHNYSTKFVNLIRNLLTPDPSLRMDIYQVVELLRNFQGIQHLPLNSMAQKIKKEHDGRDDVFNSDAWANIDDKNPIDLLNGMKKKKMKERRCNKESFQYAQARAEFADFNMEGLNNLPKAENNLDFKNFDPFSKEPEQKQNDVNFGDFGNWGNENTQQKGNGDDFNNFNFDSFGVGNNNQNNQNSEKDDPFSAFGAGNNPQNQAPQGNFWDDFGQASNQNKGNNHDQDLLNLNLGGESETVEIPQELEKPRENNPPDTNTNNLLSLDLNPQENAPVLETPQNIYSVPQEPKPTPPNPQQELNLLDLGI